MTINAQGECGQIELFYDFFGEDNIAETAETRNLGPFVVGGQGNAETDSGISTLSSDGLNGVGQMSTTDETEHTILIGTPVGIDVALMGPIVMEARVRFDTTTDLDTKSAYFGLSDVDPNTLSIETDLVTGTTTALTLTGSDMCAFYLSSELTDDEDWHAVYNGGSTTGETTAANVDLDDDAVAGEFQILRLEVDPNGTARWYIDGDLKKTVTGAISTTTDVGVVLAVECKGNAVETMDVDYLLVRCNRDWNA